MNSNSNSKIHFGDYVEKFSGKTNMWNKRWMLIESNRLVFFDKRPGIYNFLI